jgi:hypothetical protein
MRRAEYQSGEAQDRFRIEAFTAAFRNAFKLGVEGIIKAGKVLIAAKEGPQKLPHGRFLQWLENDLHLGERKVAARKAQMLMVVAKHTVLSNANHWYAFPPSWRTLYVLSHIRPRRMLELIASGKIYCGMTREEAERLFSGRAQDTGKLILSADIARVQRHSARLAIADAVRELHDDPGSITPDNLDQLAQWLTQLATALRIAAE